MLPNNYVSLHCHSDYSFLDSVAKIDDLTNKAKSLNMPGIAITEHGNICSWLKFYESCKKNGLKPIFGCEFYVTENATLPSQIDARIEELEIYAKTSLGTLFEYADNPEAFEDSVEEQMGDNQLVSYQRVQKMLNSETNSNVDSEEQIKILKKYKESIKKSNHLIVLAKNRIGYDNIMKLSSYAYQKGLFYKPRIDMKILEKYKEGLIVLSACLGGQISGSILKGNMEKAEKYVEEYKRMFGEDFYLELQLHEIEEQRIVNKGLIELMKKYKVQPVIAQDVHYVEKEDVELHEIVVKLRKKQKDDIVNENKIKEKFIENKDNTLEDNDGYFYSTKSLYFKTIDELISSWKNHHEYIHEKIFYKAIENTNIIFSKISEFPIRSEKPLLPNFDTEGLTARQFILKLIKDGAKRKLSNKITDEKMKLTYEARMKEELDTICELNFEQYFLIEWEIMNWYKNNGIGTGPGRGCLTPNSKIIIDNFLKNIKDVRIGDFVISDDGKRNKVINKFKYKISEDLVKIDHQFKDYYESPRYTKDHKILVVKNKKTNYKNNGNRKFVIPLNNLNKKMPKNIYISKNNYLNDIKPEYIESKNIEYGDFLCIPITRNKQKDIKYFDLNPNVSKFVSENKSKKNKISRYIDCDKIFLNLLGMYISDGWSISNGIAFGFHSSKNKKQRKILKQFCNKYGFIYNNIKHKNKNVIQTYIYSKSLKLLFEKLVRKYAINKNIDKSIRMLPKHKLSHLITGLMLGDGHIKKNFNDKNCYDSINESLILDIKEILITLGIPSGIKKRNADGKKIIHDSFKLSIATNDLFGKTKMYNYLSDDKYIYIPVNNVSKEIYDGYVYDLQIENNPSFRTNQYVVHNSAAGSLIAYLLDITHLDPIEHDLLFSRFINKSRSSAKFLIEFEDIPLSTFEKRKS